MRRRTIPPNKVSGFTIVELLIVVVVIAILAAITIVAYNGITGQAKDATLKSDLKTGATQLELAKVESGAYPSNGFALKASGDNAFHYSGGGNTYCLQVSSSNAKKTYRVTNASGIEEASCPAPATMQAMTPGFCASMAVYTGSNPSAVLSLTDSRGGTIRTYEVAKLADDNCWMLTSLKLGSTSSSITLTPVDTDVASNFTLPQLATTGTTENDHARAYGPVPGDTGVGATNYGYLYNWSAATAGENRTTMPAGSGDAAHSICPANWQLPSGGSNGDFAWLNAKMNNPSASNASTLGGNGFFQNWQFGGPFKGVLSGEIYPDFYNQATSGRYWTRSTVSTSSDVAYLVYVRSNLVTVTNYTDRYAGYSVRCLLR